MLDGEDDPFLEDGPSLGALGDYEILEKIAQGGMGIVYRARQRSLGREVALKLIHEGRFAGDKERRRFVLEAESAAGLDHPHITPIYDFGEEAGQLFFSMRLMERGCLLDPRATGGGLSGGKSQPRRARRPSARDSPSRHQAG